MTSLHTFVSHPLFDASRPATPDLRFPKISVVVPSYQQGPFIERTIVSVLNQGYPNLELIVIDGGSTDGTRAILERYDRHLAYWISEPDAGQSDAINKGLDWAQGDILAYLNSDDVYLPNAPLHEVARHFAHTDGAKLVYGDAFLIDTEDRVTRFIPALKFNPIEYVHGVFSIPQQSSFWNRKAWELVGRFNTDNHMTMDAEFYVMAALGGTEFVRLRKPLGGFRMYGESKTGSNRFVAERERHTARLRHHVLGEDYDQRLFRLRSTWLRARHLPAKLARRVQQRVAPPAVA